MEFQKRLYFAQEDVILNQRRKEAYEAAKQVSPKTKQEILQKWEQLKKQIPSNTRTSEEGKKSRSSKEKNRSSEETE